MLNVFICHCVYSFHFFFFCYTTSTDKTMNLQLASTIAIFISCLLSTIETCKADTITIHPNPPTSSNFNLNMRMILQRRRKVDKWESKNYLIFQKPCEDTTHGGHNNEHGNRVQINYCKFQGQCFEQGPLRSYLS
jgi:hypothetical protein